MICSEEARGGGNGIFLLPPPSLLELALSVPSSLHVPVLSFLAGASVNGARLS